MPTSEQQARQWHEIGAAPVAGTTTAASTDDGTLTWLRCPALEPGDCLIFDALVPHAGGPNRSDRVRLSADLRFQREGTEKHWEARHEMAFNNAFFGAARDAIDAVAEPCTNGVYEVAFEQLRREGPGSGDGGSFAALPTRARVAAARASRGLAPKM